MAGYSFIKKATLWNGQVQKCNKCGKELTEGADMYIQNIGTDDQKQWIRCVDLECFKSQGGKEPTKKTGGFAKKQRTNEEKIADINLMHEICWNKAVLEATKVYPLTATALETQAQGSQQFQNASSYDADWEARRILQAVFFKAYIENWIR